jgi:hypothetical protein
MDASERAEQICYGGNSNTCECGPYPSGSACEDCIEKAIRSAEQDARAEALEEAAQVAAAEEVECERWAKEMAAKGDNEGAREQRCDATQARRIAGYIRSLAKETK